MITQEHTTVGRTPQDEWPDIATISTFYITPRVYLSIGLKFLHRAGTNLKLCTQVCFRSEVYSSNSYEKPTANIDFLCDYSRGSLPTAAASASGSYKGTTNYKGC
jgi:hypothetical protein